MSNGIATLIQADLASLSNAARNLAGDSVAAAAQFAGGGAGAAPASSFADSMKQAIGKVNEDDRVAGQRMADVDSGKSEDLVGAMLASQEANLSFSMLMQVRNKVMGAVDELIKLPL
ncbi:flagellar hook-basal body complex protein FliE [Rugamonas sp. DEMB1]|uniref:flagellar hook-basal body complex protein FliE n=1 Tax=Rugamonas sp. DEMB1 TaxID=3039386 RepID=UPI002448A39E|nr:flagellar hook-basal body complex protein FliE [Rugamonas sp. DEMB1]WGG48357.1 flagellar hook-basal body complex protein FliE [Rugamonas sp. DEMB1]